MQWVQGGVRRISSTSASVSVFERLHRSEQGPGAGRIEHSFSCTRARPFFFLLSTYLTNDNLLCLPSPLSTRGFW